MSDSPVRIDAWLWAVRQYKTRSAATAACRAGHVRVNGERAKAAQSVRPGDEVRVRIDGFDRMLVVRQTLVKRVSAAVAAERVLYWRTAHSHASMRTGESDMQPAYDRTSAHQMSSIVTRNPTT